MKILIIHNKYGKFSGEEAVVESQIKLLKSKGHKIITYLRSSEEIGTQLQNKAKAFFTAFYNKDAIAELKNLISAESPDVVHIHNLYPIISPAILPEIKKMGIPIVMTVHNYRLLCPNGLFFSNGAICEKCTDFGKELNCITQNCEGSLLKSTGYAFRNMWARNKKYYLENVDAFLCLTNFQKNKLIANQFCANKCFVVPNMYTREVPSTNYKLQDRNYIAFAGRISPEKGISFLFKAAQKLPHINFHIAGQMRDGYKFETKKPDNVIFRGMLDAQQMKVFYTNARLYLHTSICYEGFPMVFPEAMAFKLPIIAPKFAGYPEIAEDGINGCLYEPNSIKDLCKVISLIWGNEKKLKTMGENGFRKMQKEYSSDKYYELLNNAYEKLLKK